MARQLSRLLICQFPAQALYISSRFMKTLSTLINSQNCTITCLILMCVLFVSYKELLGCPQGPFLPKTLYTHVHYFTESPIIHFVCVRRTAVGVSSLPPFISCVFVGRLLESVLSVLFLHCENPVAGASVVSLGGSVYLLRHCLGSLLFRHH